MMVLSPSVGASEPALSEWAAPVGVSTAFYF
jgi:hypothetical protein